MWLSKRIGSIGARGLFIPILKYLFAGGVMAALVFYMSGFVDWLRDPFGKRALYLCAMVLAGGAAYFIVCALAGVEEMRHIMDRLGTLRSRG